LYRSLYFQVSQAIDDLNKEMGRDPLNIVLEPLTSDSDSQCIQSSQSANDELDYFLSISDKGGKASPKPISFSHFYQSSEPSSVGHEPISKFQSPALDVVDSPPEPSPTDKIDVIFEREESESADPCYLQSRLPSISSSDAEEMKKAIVSQSLDQELLIAVSAIVNPLSVPNVDLTKLNDKEGVAVTEGVASSVKDLKTSIPAGSLVDFKTEDLILAKKDNDEAAMVTALKTVLQTVATDSSATNLSKPISGEIAAKVDAVDSEPPEDNEVDSDESEGYAKQSIPKSASTSISSGKPHLKISIEGVKVSDAIQSIHEDELEAPFSSNSSPFLYDDSENEENEDSVMTKSDYSAAMSGVSELSSFESNMKSAVKEQTTFVVKGDIFKSKSAPRSPSDEPPELSLSDSTSGSEKEEEKAIEMAKEVDISGTKIEDVVAEVLQTSSPSAAHTQEPSQQPRLAITYEGVQPTFVAPYENVQPSWGIAYKADKALRRQMVKVNRRHAKFSRRNAKMVKPESAVVISKPSAKVPPPQSRLAITHEGVRGSPERQVVLANRRHVEFSNARALTFSNPESAVVIADPRQPGFSITHEGDDDDDGDNPERHLVLANRRHVRFSNARALAFTNQESVVVISEPLSRMPLRQPGFSITHEGVDDHPERQLVQAKRRHAKFSKSKAIAFEPESAVVLSGPPTKAPSGQPRLSITQEGVDVRPERQPVKVTRQYVDFSSKTKALLHQPVSVVLPSGERFEIQVCVQDFDEKEEEEEEEEGDAGDRMMVFDHPQKYADVDDHDSVQIVEVAVEGGKEYSTGIVTEVVSDDDDGEETLISEIVREVDVEDGIGIEEIPETVKEVDIEDALVAEESPETVREVDIEESSGERSAAPEASYSFTSPLSRFNEHLQAFEYVKLLSEDTVQRSAAGAPEYFSETAAGRYYGSRAGLEVIRALIDAKPKDGVHPVEDLGYLFPVVPAKAFGMIPPTRAFLIKPETFLLAKASQLAELPTASFGVLLADQVASVRPSALQGASAAHWKALSRTALESLEEDGGLAKVVGFAGLTSAQLQALLSSKDRVQAVHPRCFHLVPLQRLAGLKASYVHRLPVRFIRELRRASFVGDEGARRMLFGRLSAAQMAALPRRLEDEAEHPFAGLEVDLQALPAKVLRSMSSLTFEALAPSSYSSLGRHGLERLSAAVKRRLSPGALARLPLECFTRRAVAELSFLNTAVCGHLTAEQIPGLDALHPACLAGVAPRVLRECLEAAPAKGVPAQLFRLMPEEAFEEALLPMLVELADGRLLREEHWRHLGASQCQHIRVSAVRQMGKAGQRRFWAGVPADCLGALPGLPKLHPVEVAAIPVATLEALCPAAQALLPVQAPSALSDCSRLGRVDFADFAARLAKDPGCLARLPMLSIRSLEPGKAPLPVDLLAHADHRVIASLPESVLLRLGPEHWGAIRDARAFRGVDARLLQHVPLADLPVPAYEFLAPPVFTAMSAAQLNAIPREALAKAVTRAQLEAVSPAVMAEFRHLDRIGTRISPSSKDHPCCGITAAQQKAMPAGQLAVFQRHCSGVFESQALEASLAAGM
jgi:hypothetical protein